MPTAAYVGDTSGNREDSSFVDGSGEGSGGSGALPEGSGGGTKDYSDNDRDDFDETKKNKGDLIPKRPIPGILESNVIPKNTDLVTRREGTVYSSKGSTSFSAKISLLKAVVSYVFPICVIWLGGSISEWL